MPLQTVLIYASGAALIALMAGFAAHNKKTGWKRARPTLLEALNDLYSDLGLGVEAPQAAITPISHSTQPDVDFSAQLLKLRGVLGSSTGVSSDTRQLVKNGSRR